MLALRALAIFTSLFLAVLSRSVHIPTNVTLERRATFSNPLNTIRVRPPRHTNNSSPSSYYLYFPGRRPMHALPQRPILPHLDSKHQHRHPISDHYRGTQDRAAPGHLVRFDGGEVRFIGDGFILFIFNFNACAPVVGILISGKEFHACSS